MTTKGEETMRYIIETVGGDELEVHDTLAEATQSARNRLEDDPELGTLEVFSFGTETPTGTHVKTITHGPDAHWNSVVVVLDPGEKVQAPGYVPRQITDDDLEAYERGSYKRAAVERAIGEWI